MQTSVSAFLPAASVALLYGLVRLFDMRGRKPAVAEPQRIEFPEVEQAAEPLAALAEPPAQQPAETRPAKPPRKPRAKKAKVVELVPAAAAETLPPDYSDESAHFPLEPLFEPVPIVRQQRTVFGRKAG